MNASCTHVTLATEDSCILPIYDSWLSGREYILAFDKSFADAALQAFKDDHDEDAFTL